MPLMRPPQGWRGTYNRLSVKPGDLVNVLPQDAAAHEREGWEVVADTTLSGPAAVTDGEE